MSQDLTTTTSRPTITLREAEAKIEVWHGRLEVHPAHPNRYCVPRARAVSTDDRRLLCAVRERLERALEPCTDRDAVDAVIARLLLGFDLGRGLSAEDAADMRVEYAEAAAGLPLAALVEAAARFRAGKTLTPWKRGYRPNTGEFAEEARAGLVGLRVRLTHVRRLLDAEVYDPPTDADRARVADLCAALAADLAARSEAMRLDDAAPVKSDPGPDIRAHLADLEARRMRRLDCERSGAAGEAA